MDIVYILGASFSVMIMSLSGKLATWKGVGALIERNLHFFVSFAAGVLLMVAYHLAAEIVEHTGSIAAGIPWIAIGAVVVLIAFKYIPQFHHHHDKGDHAHSEIDANRVLASDAIHNIGDGAVIAVSFVTSPILGLTSTISIMVHESLQEISEFFVLREAGFSVRRALVSNFLTSATILVGAIGAYLLVETFEFVEIPLMGLAVGSYLVVIFNDLIPHSWQRSEGGHHFKHVAFFIAGLCLMFLVVTLLPHAEVGH